MDTGMSTKPKQSEQILKRLDALVGLSTKLRHNITELELRLIPPLPECEASGVSERTEPSNFTEKLIYYIDNIESNLQEVDVTLIRLMGEF